MEGSPVRESVWEIRVDANDTGERLRVEEVQFLLDGREIDQPDRQQEQATRMRMGLTRISLITCIKGLAGRGTS